MALTKVKGSVWDSADNGLAVSVKDFGVVGDGSTDDTAAIQAAFNALTEHTAIVFDGNQYSINGVISLNTNNITIVFQGTTFLVGDTGTSGSFDAGTGTVTGKIGFLFDQADNLTLLGEVTMLGQGTVGVTSLAGVVFTQCDDLSCKALMRFDTMAAGRFVINCDRPILGNAYGNKMDGLQTFESPPSTNAGTVEVLIGCQYGLSGDIFSFDAEKPARYMSIGFGRGNYAMVCGTTVAEYNGSSLTAHSLGIRSAVDCSFGSVIGKSGIFNALYLEQNTTTYSIDRIYIESVQGDIGSTGASVDSLIYSAATTGSIGTIAIGTVIGDCSGEHGIYINSGKLSIGYALLSGSSNRLIQIAPVPASGLKPEIHIGHLNLEEFSGIGQPILIGKGASFSCGRLNISSGPTAAVTIAVYYSSTIGDGSYHNGIHIGSIEYRQNGSINNYAILVYDDSTTAGPGSVTVQNVTYSDASTTDIRIGNANYSARGGRLLGSSAPSTTAGGTWRVADQIIDITPTSASPMGWACSVAGNPGTWLTMPSYA